MVGLKLKLNEHTFYLVSHGLQLVPRLLYDTNYEGLFLDRSYSNEPLGHVLYNKNLLLRVPLATMYQVLQANH
jgi:hypothetical protein